MTRTEGLWFSLFPQWVLANMIGWSAYSFVFENQFLYIGLYMGAGAFIGFVQWLVLKIHLRMEATWILVSAFTYGALFVSFRFVPNESYVQFFPVSMIILFGIGLFQRSVLEYYLDHSILWVIASACTGAIGLFVIPSIKNLLFPTGSSTVSWMLYGLFYGTITGTTLIFLFTKTIEKTPAPGRET
jgi:hypothetical protein